jgi:nitrogen fixation protein NifQ
MTTAAPRQDGIRAIHPAPRQPSDGVLFARIVALGEAEAKADSTRPLTAALGLSRAALARLVDRHLPQRRGLVDALPADAGPGDDALEEPDLRAFLREHAVADTDEAAWLTAIVARRSLGANHLWQDLGLAGRGELNTLLRRHFPALVALNAADMKWKKFFYRALCLRDGILVCKSPHCEGCSDRAECFGAETGAPLLRPV